MKLLSISNLRRFTKHLKNTKNRSHTTRQLLKSAKLTVSTGGNGINTSLRTYSLPPVRPIQDYAKSVLEIAEHEMKLPNGNLTLATDYLELVASSNAEHVTRAAELLKEVKSKIQEHETEQVWFYFGSTSAMTLWQHMLHLKQGVALLCFGNFFSGI